VAKKIKASASDSEPGSAPVAAIANGGDEKAPRRAAAKAKKVPAKKTAAKRSNTKAPASPLPSEDQIRIRAYFISERRHRLALPGDATSDWEEARRQLLSEMGPR
jgi:hypothetical protein